MQNLQKKKARENLMCTHKTGHNIQLTNCSGC